jgi:anthranilate phosphoribosyltransferase
MQEAIKALVDGGSLSAEQAEAAMQRIMSGEATQAQIGAFLAALRVRGETAEVVAACAKVMQAHAEPIPVDDVIDVVGTGGDGVDTFNVSTAAAIVVAGAGARVAKHGNRAMSSKSGSADILEALGARTDLGGGAVARIINDCGFCYVFAQRFHPAMRHVAGPRRELGVRTVFNILGPLTNPASPHSQLTGVGSATLAPLVAEAFRLRNMRRVVVVHSNDGMDEISPAAPTHAWFIQGSAMMEKEISAEDFGLKAHAASAVSGGTAEENAKALIEVLAGKPGPVTDFTLMNAAAAAYVAGLAPDLKAGVDVARDSIRSGKAKRVLERYVKLSQDLSG